MSILKQEKNRESGFCHLPGCLALCPQIRLPDCIVVQQLLRHKSGTTILLVEQNAQMALSVANRAYVLETGKIVTTGTGAELLASPAIKKAYLGG